MIKRSAFTVFFCSILMLQGQYTDQINSNRPGASIGAFAVGKNIIQFEAGAAYRSYKHSGYNNATFGGKVGFFAVRWGFLAETLELTYEGIYMHGNLTSNLTSVPNVQLQKGFTQNFIGLKYLIYDPFKKEKEVNVYSWKANNGFKLRELIPAVSLTVGPNFNLGKNNTFSYGNVFNNLYRPLFYQNLNTTPDTEPFMHLRATLATQSHFLGTWVFVTNFSYDRYLSDYPEKSYILTLTHTFHPLWSVYVENQGIRSTLYKDTLFRAGAAYLLTDNIQIEATLGSNIKDTPQILFVNAGVSYRLDFHKDYISAEEKEMDALKKGEKSAKKLIRKDSRGERKRNRNAKRRN